MTQTVRSSVRNGLTLSALASTFGGIVRPIFLAVLRLMTNSNFVACCTGRSAGLGTFQDLVDVNRRAPVLRSPKSGSVGHETALTDKLLLDVNSRQPVFAGKLDDPLFLAKKRGLTSRHNRVDPPSALRLRKALSKPLASGSISSNFSFSAKAAGLSSFIWVSSAGSGDRRSPTRARLGTVSLSISNLLVLELGSLNSRAR